MGDLLAGSAARVAGGIAILGCVAAIALAAAGPGVFGGLGSLFGQDGASLEIAKQAPSAADILAAPTAADRAAVVRAVTRPPRRDGGAGSPRSGSRAPSSPAPHSPSSGPAPALPPLAPGPNPAPSLPPPSPAPSPGSGQVVATLGDAVKEVTSQAPPETQPLAKPLTDAVDTLVQACRGLPACP